MRKSLWMAAVLTLCTTLPAGAVVVRAFGSGDGLGGGFDYSYGGSTWDPLSVSQVVGATFVEIGGAGAPGVTEQGGAGLFFGSRDLSVPGPVGVLVEARFGALDASENPGPDGFQLNFVPNSGSGESIQFDKSLFSGVDFVSVVLPINSLTAGQLADIQQVQVQGRDFSGTAGRFNWEFRRIETVTLAPAFVLGDFNFDGGVDASDIDPFVVAANEGDPFAGYIASAESAFGELYPGQTLTAEIVNQIGDFNGDGGVDASDIDPFVVFANNGGLGVAAIPEPATLGIVAMAGLLVGRRRR